MNLQDICEEAVADMEGCLGCAVADLRSGLPLAIKAGVTPLVGKEALELLTAASVEYFRGRMMWQLQLTLCNGEPSANFAHEIQTKTQDTYNFMSVVPKRENTVLVLVFDKATNLGLDRISLRQVLERLSESDECLEDGQQAESPAAPVAMSSTFAPHAPNRANMVGSTDMTDMHSEVAQSTHATHATHVPYRDTSAGDDPDSNDDTPNLEPAPPVREWRGGLSGRKNHH